MQTFELRNATLRANRDAVVVVLDDQGLEVPVNDVLLSDDGGTLFIRTQRAATPRD